MYFANSWDAKTEAVLDQRMCTEICPCYQTEAYENRPVGGEQIRTDAYFKYENILNTTYIKHNRIFKRDYIHELKLEVTDYREMDWSRIHENSF
jgi:hypothetical protein